MSKAWPVLLALSTVVATVAVSDGVGKLPTRLSGYRSWAVTGEPRKIPRELSMACAPPSLFEDARERLGPHAFRWIKVSANANAAAAMQKHDLSAFPAGSVIVKEKLLSPTDSSPDGLAFMVKHEKGKFTASGGWEFLYYPKPEDAGAMTGCVTCQRAGARRDYVFGTFDRDETGE